MRQATVHALAVVGFVAVLFGGMVAAVYAARFVPTMISGVTGAAVTLAGVFTPAGDADVVPGDDTDGSVVLPVDEVDDTATPTTPVTPTPATPSRGTETTTTTQVGGGTATPVSNPNGFIDLMPTLIDLGTMSGNTLDSFTATSTLENSKKIGIRFSVENKGTKASGEWRFTVTIPTTTAYTYESPVQQSLMPGERIEYALGFDRANAGTNQLIAITVDRENKVIEGNEGNNSASRSVTIFAR